MEDSPNLFAELHSLVGIFFADVSQLGKFREIVAAETPEPQHALLNHEHHMTVTVEKFHSCPVNVEVIQATKTEQSYSREILLRKTTDQTIVQYGIVRLNFEHLAADVIREIEAKETPLGRILINHNVLRQVKLLSLYEIVPGLRMQEVCNLSPEHSVCGRTALIYCDDKPAVELLEVVIV